MAVPYTFGSATSAIPLSQLDSNFATTITLGNTAIQLGNTVTTLNNMTLANVTVTTVSGASANAVVYTNSTGQVTANSSVIALDTSGNLGLGVTPSAWSQGKAFEIKSAGTGIFNNTVDETYYSNNAYYNAGWKYGATNYAEQYIQYAGQHIWKTAPSGTAGNAISFTQAMTLDASGNLGIGTTSPSKKFVVSNGGAAGVELDPFTRSATTGASLLAYNRSGSAFVRMDYDAEQHLFFTSTTERARIDSSGNLLVGKTAINNTNTGFSVDANFGFGGGGVRVVNSISTGSADGFQMYSTGASAYRFYVSFNGTISATSTSISAISDIRYKENVRDLNVGLAEVLALKPRLYDWKEGKGADIKNARGFIAQEFEEVFPDLIDEWRDPAPEGEEPYKSVRQDLIPVLVKAIQEMKTIIDQQAERIAALEAK